MEYQLKKQEEEVTETDSILNPFGDGEGTCKRQSEGERQRFHYVGWGKRSFYNLAYIFGVFPRTMTLSDDFRKAVRDANIESGRLKRYPGQSNDNPLIAIIDSLKVDPILNPIQNGIISFLSLDSIHVIDRFKYSPTGSIDLSYLQRCVIDGQEQLKSNSNMETKRHFYHNSVRFLKAQIRCRYLLEHRMNNRASSERAKRSCRKKLNGIQSFLHKINSESLLVNP